MNQNSPPASPVLFQSIENIIVGPVDIFLKIFFCFTYIVDVVTDILVAVHYFRDGHTNFFTLTVCFITVPAVAMTAFSLKECQTGDKPRKVWIVKIILSVLSMAPVWSILEAVYYSLKSIKSNSPNEKKLYAEKMISKTTEARFLRLFESFLESGPQLVLQIYIFSEMQSLKPNTFTKIEMLQSVSIFTSLISISYAIPQYQISLDTGKHLSWTDSVVIFLWRFFEITSRVMALGLIAFVSSSVFWIVCAVHYTVMSIWAGAMNTDFWKNDKYGQRIYNAVAGVIFLFVYFDPKVTPNRRNRIFYYVVVFVENTALMTVWFHYYTSGVNLKLPAMIIHFLSFVLGIAIMFAYFNICHPDERGLATNNISGGQVPNDETDIMLGNVKENTEGIRS